MGVTLSCTDVPMWMPQDALKKHSNTTLPIQNYWWIMFHYVLSFGSIFKMQSYLTDYVNYSDHVPQNLTHPGIGLMNCLFECAMCAVYVVTVVVPSWYVGHWFFVDNAVA